MALHLFNNDDFFSPFFASFQSHPPRFNCGRALADAPRPTLLDVQEKDKAFEVAADLPGVNKDDIKLHVEGDVLSLAVERNSQQQDEREEEGVKVHRMERSAAFLKRSLRMPESADLSQIQARYQDGVLRLNIPKHDEEVSRSRAIPIE